MNLDTVGPLHIWWTHSSWGSMHKNYAISSQKKKNHSMKKRGGHRVPLLAEELVQLTGAQRSVGPGRSAMLWWMATHPALYKFHRSDWQPEEKENKTHVGWGEEGLDLRGLCGGW